MLETPHVILGATIATKIPNPLVALPLAFLSHFVLDLIPHWNPDLYWESQKHGQPLPRTNLIVILDIILSLGGGLAIAALSWPNIAQAVTIVLACFLAVIPDVIEGFYFFLRMRNQSLINLIKFQRRHQRRAAPALGIITQIMVILLSLYILQS